MIKNITGGKGITVSGGSPGSTYINMSNPSAGMMRYNGTDTQIYDGTSWLTMNTSYATVELDFETQSLLSWARDKRNEEMLLEKQAQESPAIKDLVDQIKEKKEQITMIQTLLNSPGNEPEQVIKPSMVP